MLRCIEIARNGLGVTAPNPAVGAVLVCNEKIIGEGYTSAYGGAHAEVNAIQSVTDPELLKEATMYVTLEPCSHYGKTPPCADLIIQCGIPKVVIGLLDPHDKVAGRGIQRLKDAGCEVTVGVLHDECREHHRRFLTYHEKKRPYIILKWAETSDGFIAPEKKERAKHPEPFWITNTFSRQIVHQWRSEEQAILVGTNTVLEDNPKLDVRLWHGKSPVRVIIDRTLKTPKEYNILDGSVKTIVITEVLDTAYHHQNVIYEVVDFTNNFTQNVMDILFKHNITSVLIEGGAKTLQAFQESNLWDEARVFKGQTIFKKGVKAPQKQGQLVAEKKILEDQLTIWRA